jgi:2-polyprenyl-3-methyl-5-hydroxy-6-metoxy-1,4-benzoquinol methylase
VIRASWPSEELEDVRVCPACGGTRRTPLYAGLRDRPLRAPGEWSLQRCGACQSAYLDPRPTESSVMRAYANYDTHARPGPPREEAGAVRAVWVRLRHGYLNHLWGYALQPASPAGRFLVPMLPNARRLDEAIRRLSFPGPGARLLDVGCGNGGFVMFMSRLGWDSEGLDPDVEAVAAARAAGVKARVGTAGDMTEQDGVFDAVTLNHVIEHIHDPAGALARVRQRLKPGGVVWVATPNVAAPGHRMFGRDWFGLDPPRHLSLLSPKGLSELMRASGFARMRYERPTARIDAIVIRGSHALATGRDSVHDVRPLPTAVRLRYRLAQRAALTRAESGEELVVMAEPS